VQGHEAPSVRKKEDGKYPVRTLYHICDILHIEREHLFIIFNR
jgi:hypothetical protein